MHISKTQVSAAVIFFLLALCVTPEAFPETYRKNNSIELTLRKTIAIAFMNNKNVQIQERGIAIAKAAILGVKSEFLPTIDLDWNYKYNAAVIEVDKAVIPQTDKGFGVSAGYKNDNFFGLSFTETFYRGGGRIADFKKAELGLRVQAETLRATRLDVEFEAKRLYNGLLLAYETARIMQNLVSQAEAHYEDVKNRFEQGVSSRFDLLQSKVHVSKSIPDLVDSTTAIDLIKAELKKLLYIRMQDTIIVRDKRLTYAPIKLEEGKFLDEAYVNKPEMILRELGIDISRWSIERAKADNLPTVDGKASYSYRSNALSDMFNYYHTNWTAGVFVSVPLYDGLSARAKVDEAKARYAQANLAKEDMVEAVAVDVRRACLDLVKAEAIIDSQKDAVVEAKEALRLSEVRYDTGVGINLDVLDAQVSLSQVEQNLAEGIYDYLMAEAFLDKTMGKESLRKTGDKR